MKKEETTAKQEKTKQEKAEQEKTKQEKAEPEKTEQEKTEQEKKKEKKRKKPGIIIFLRNSRFGQFLSKIFAPITRFFGVGKVSLELVDYFIIGVIILGLGLLVYPTIGDLYSRWKTMQSVNDYNKVVDEMDDQQIEDEIERARRYNRTLWGTRYLGIGEDEPDGSNFMKEGDEEYKDILNITKNGVIGYLVIDKINSYSTIYHGSTDSVLAAGVGHLYSTGFTVDGPNVHGLLSAHTGLVSATLFTDLDQIEIGDCFEIHILDRVFTYQVDQILIVDPSDLAGLQIEYGSNYVTLITCYPYGINSHRLLVRGHLQGYNYNREDYEEYFEYEQPVEAEEIANWEKEDEKLTQTGIPWTDIGRLAATGIIIMILAGLFYLSFRKKRKEAYVRHKKTCTYVFLAGMSVFLISGFISIGSLIEEYAAGKECEQRMQELKEYFESSRQEEDSGVVFSKKDSDEGDKKESGSSAAEGENMQENEPDTEQTENHTDSHTGNHAITVGKYSYIGKLSFPSLDLELPVMSECTEENLEIAPCVDMGTVEDGNLVIAGHRYRKIFSNLEKLQVGDKIYLTTAENKLYTYMVKSCVEIIPRKQDLYYGYYNWNLALYTCSSGGKNRYVVYAELMEE